MENKLKQSSAFMKLANRHGQVFLRYENVHAHANSNQFHFSDFPIDVREYCENENSLIRIFR
jgi:hypothetical protein